MEALRILYDLDMQFDNLRGARERVRRQALLSEELRKQQQEPPSQQKTASRLESRVIYNPVRLAESRYVQQHGPYFLSGVIEKLFDELFPPAD